MIQSEAERKYDWLPFYISKAPQNFIVSNLLLFKLKDHRNSFCGQVFSSRRTENLQKTKQNKKLASIVLLSFKELVFLTFFFFCSFFLLLRKTFFQYAFFFLLLL